MRLGIMQPYPFPYIGYFQLINVVDYFVIHDDAQWIKGGWINRNRILVQGRTCYFTLSIQKDSSTLNINQRIFVSNIEEQKKKVIRQLESAYRKAPHFEQVMDLVSRCFKYQTRNVSKFIINSLHECCDYLNISTPFKLSSELKKNNGLKAQDRVIEINKVMNADHYINLIGGIELYNKDTFRENDLRLSFIKPRMISYEQFGNEHVPFLSILDVMMHNSVDIISELIQEYDLK